VRDEQDGCKPDGWVMVDVWDVRDMKPILPPSPMHQIYRTMALRVLSV